MGHLYLVCFNLPYLFYMNTVNLISIAASSSLCVILIRHHQGCHMQSKALSVLIVMPSEQLTEWTG